MKKLILAVAMLLSAASFALADNNVSYTQNGTEFTQTSNNNSNEKERKTGCTWTDSKGVKYDIYMSAKGRCYVYKTSKKTGEKYKYYLPKEMDAKVAEQMKNNK